LKQTGNDEFVMASLSRPTPGGPNEAQTDSDTDGLPDAWELAHGLNPDSAGDAASDPDRDGLSNLQEYLCDTHPRQASSRLELLAFRDRGMLELRFRVRPNRTYAIQSRDALQEGSWTNIHEIAPRQDEGDGIIRELIVKNEPEIFFRLVVRP